MEEPCVMAAGSAPALEEAGSCIDGEGGCMEEGEGVICRVFAIHDILEKILHFAFSLRRYERGLGGGGHHGIPWW